MQKRASLVLATVLLVSAAGCAGLRDLARSAFQTPKLTFRSASVDALDLEGATIGLTFDLANPNGFGLDLARVAWGLDMEGTRVAAGEMPGGLAIAAKATSPVTIPVRVRFRDVPGIVSLLTTRRDSVRYKVSGTAGVNTPIGVVDLPLAHEDTLRLPGLPGFSLEGISIRGVSLSTVALDLRLRVRNPNGFAIPPGRLDYALSIAGAEVASASEAALAKVAAGGSALVSIPVKVSLLKVGSAASALVSGGEVPVGLAGKAEVAGLPLPLDLRGNVPARR
jgi:LEA14-like dessication related protein